MRNFVAKRIQSVPPSGIRRFFDIAATMKDVISLGIGEPDFVTPTPILRAGIHSLRLGDTHYTSNSGTMELRQAVSIQMKHLYDVSYDPEEEILITVGASEALHLALSAILDPGDEVIVPEPCFVAYTPEVVFADGIPVTVPTYVKNDFQVTGEEIERAVTPRTKAILIGYPNNPTGAVMSRENLERVGEVAKKNDLLIISDELYSRLVYHREHVCVPSIPGLRERTILVNGFSKGYAMTGWRLGYVAAPKELMAAMRKIHQYTIMSAPTVAQAAGLDAVLHGEYYVREMLAEYDRRRELLIRGLNSLGLDCFEPQGAFYAFPSVAKTGMDDEQFSEALLREEQVAVVPGSAFGPSGKGFVRLCYATAYEKIEQALDHMKRFMQRHG
ncbi:MAG: aminotransferase class I/II-fold pyridoxal phosphate-dependent enzyme [Anaerolineales bacterium]|nr:aminotransferase class I/II-fold pyridoxal phosphate-dependent enzyme [Anaerolineales bacterium]